MKKISSHVFLSASVSSYARPNCSASVKTGFRYDIAVPSKLGGNTFFSESRIFLTRNIYLRFRAELNIGYFRYGIRYENHYFYSAGNSFKDGEIKGAIHSMRVLQGITTYTSRSKAKTISAQQSWPRFDKASTERRALHSIFIGVGTTCYIHKRVYQKLLLPISRQDQDLHKYLYWPIHT